MVEREDVTSDGRTRDAATLVELVDLARLASLGVDPAGLALTDGSARLTWSELDARIEALADDLVASGLEPGERVAIHLTKSAESFVAAHAVLRSGGVLVPLDPLAPRDMVHVVLEDAEAAVLVTDGRPAVVELLASVPSIRHVLLAPSVEVPEDPEKPVRPYPTSPRPMDRPDRSGRVGPDDPAYIIYTSGSTGRPKGIVHTHRSALAYARAAARLYELTSDDILANVAPLHFDQSTFELYAAPLVGAAVVVVPEATLRFPASIAALVEQEGATIWYSVPYILRQLAERGALESRDLAFRWVLFGGEVFPPEELRALMNLLPGARFSNVYGPAEVNQCMFFHVDVPAPDQDVPIGVAWDAAEVVLVDAPAGGGGPPEVVEGDGVGEIWVAGPTMMREYWRNQQATSGAIFEGSVGDLRGERWYRTGDLARRQDGRLVFVGRVDNQVKVRGQRVELEAVERELAASPGVRDAAVVVLGGELTAALVVDGDGEPEAVVARARRMLPAAAVPSRAVRVDVIPRNRNGKIDRREVLRIVQAL